MTEIGPKDEN